MTRGYTLLEVVVALLLLEVAILGALGTLTVAARTLGEAERVELAVAAAEGVLDSLAGIPSPTSGSRPVAGGELAWTVDSTGLVALRASPTDGEPWLDFTATAGVP